MIHDHRNSMGLLEGESIVARDGGEGKTDSSTCLSVHPIFLGETEIPSNVWYAPLAGCSDWPYRMMSSEWNPGLMFTEMVKMDALVRADEGTYELLHYSDCMHPIGAQLFGSSLRFAKESAPILEDMGFDVIDLNCGCPVDKVTKGGGGSGLLKTPFLVGDIVSSIVEAVHIPVTVKVRAGWDDQHINIEEIVAIVESAGAKAITVHGRTRQQGYSGSCCRDWIRRAKKAAKQIPVIGNGDIFTPEAALSMMSETGCDGVLIARGGMGKPWFVEDIRRVSQGKEPMSFSFLELREMLLRHFNYIVEYKCEKKALVDARRIGCWYVSHVKGAKAFRLAISHAQSIEEARSLIRDFVFEPLL